MRGAVWDADMAAVVAGGGEAVAGGEAAAALHNQITIKPSLYSSLARVNITIR